VRGEEQAVAGLKFQALPSGRRLQLVGADSVGRARRKRDALRGGETREIHERAASRDATPRPLLDAEGPAGLVRELLFGHAVVEAILPMPTMPQSVPLRRRLRVEVVVDVIEDIFPPPVDGVAQNCAVEQRRIRSLQFQVQREHLPLLNQPRGGGHPFRRQQIQCPDLIVVAKYAPGGMRRMIRFDWQFIESWQTFRQTHQRLAPFLRGYLQRTQRRSVSAAPCRSRWNPSLHRATLSAPPSS